VFSCSSEPTIGSYWTNTNELFGQNFFIRQTMSADMFSQLKASFSFDYETLLRDLAIQFQKYWNPFVNVAVDESLVGTKTRSRFRVYIPRKPHPNGIKFWSISDSSTYLFYFSMFTKEYEPAESTLVRMVNSLPEGKNFNVFADSYFGGEKAAEELSKNGHRYIFAVKADRAGSLFSRFLHTKDSPIGVMYQEEELQDTTSNSKEKEQVDEVRKILLHLS